VQYFLQGRSWDQNLCHDVKRLHKTLVMINMRILFFLVFFPNIQKNHIYVLKSKFQNETIIQQRDLKLEKILLYIYLTHTTKN